MAIKRNLVSNFLGQGWVAAMSLAFIPVYIDRLGVEAYALIGFYAVLQGWLALLDLGMTPTMTREMARASAGAHTANSIADLLRSIEVVCFGLAGVIAAILWLSSGWLAQEWFSPQYLSRQSIADAIAIMALVAGSRFCEGIYRGALFGMERQVWYNSVNALLATARYGGAAAIVIWVNPTVEAFFWWQAIISLLTVATFAIAAHRWMVKPERPPRFSIGALKSVATFAGGLSLTILTGLLITHFDKVMLSRLLNLDVFGHYMLAVAISGLFPMLIFPVVSAFYPPLTKAVTSGDESEVIRRYYIASELAALFLAPALAVCVVLPDKLIFAWTGDEALATAVGPLLRFLSIGIACNSLLQVPFALQLAHGWTDLGLKINCAAFAIMIPVEYFAAVQFGAIGAAVAWAAVNVALLPVVTVIMHRRLLTDEVRRWTYHAVVVPLICSLSIVSILVWLAPDASTRFSALMIVAGAGFVGFVGVLLCLPETRQMLYAKRWMRRPAPIDSQ